MGVLASWPLVPLTALAVPSTFALAGVASPRRAGLASGAAFGFASLVALAASLSGGAATGAVSSLGVRIDATTCVMLLLVASLGAVIVRFSSTYLDGDPAITRYLRWLLLTLGAVTALVIANDLLVMALAWTAASLTLHQLLTVYADRPAALLAAHKKFLVSRLADAALVPSLWLLHANVGSFDLDRISAWVNARGELPPSMQLAAALLVVAVALRSAQLPFHGWIIQVMEAPTPVSALLHAGVVNVGGFVLIRLAPWVSHAEPARLALVVIGLLTTTVAALVMTTRVSVKVALAWSTCAQMGFMLLECGLGLWPLALLHLVAHSLYKAHAFLRAGSTVDDWKISAATGKRRPASPVRLGVAVLLAVGLASLGHVALGSLGHPPSHVPSALVLALLLALSLVPVLTAGAPGGARGAGALALRAGGIVILYFGSHALAERVILAQPETSSAVGWWLTSVGFIGLFTIKSALQVRPTGAFARALHPWLFSGLYLDELFTRLTFRVWPPRVSRAPRRADHDVVTTHAPAAIEAQS
jgi:NAD(P)H-quinone oxidoreductase subunit 5